MAATVIRLHRNAEALWERASQLDESPDTWDQAELLYIEALAIDPAHARSMTNIGNIAYRRGDWQQAADWYRLALAVDNDQPEALYNLGHVCLDRGDSKAAEAWLRYAVECDDSFADAWYNLAMAYEANRKTERARWAWGKYLERADRSSDRQWIETARRHLAAL